MVLSPSFQNSGALVLYHGVYVAGTRCVPLGETDWQSTRSSWNVHQLKYQIKWHLILDCLSHINMVTDEVCDWNLLQLAFIENFYFVSWYTKYKEMPLFWNKPRIVFFTKRFWRKKWDSELSWKIYQNQ